MRLRFLTPLLALAAACGPAAAHHPMGGQVPATLWQGLLSGLGHPIIGWDHLLFLLVAALAAAVGRMPLRAAWLAGAAFVLGGTAGTLARVPGLEFPGGELAVAATLMLGALWLGLRRTPGMTGLLPLAVTAGAAHGFAFGEAVIGAETTPLMAYMSGLAAVQAGMLAAIFMASRRWLLACPPARLQHITRAAAALAAAAGAWLAFAS